MASPFHPLLFWLRRPTAARSPAFRIRPRLSTLEDRTTPTTVDITTDLVDATDNKTSLREAVQLFNADPDDFLARSISFAPELKGATFTLTAGELSVTGKAGSTNKLLTVSNNDALITLSGNNASRMLNVGVDAEVSLGGKFLLTAGKANKGGALFNAGTVTLNTVTIDGNEAGEGGGIYNDATGTLTFQGGTISNNKATIGNGGGILDAAGQGLSVVNALVRGNTAADGGGGIFAGNLTLVNVTVTDNAADDDGGGTWTNGQLLSIHSTVVLNRADRDGDGIGKGGGVFIATTPAPAGTAILSNTLIGGNLVGTGTTAGDIAGTVAGAATSKNNFVADPASAGGLTHGGANKNILGNGAGAAVAINTVIVSTLAANGGTGPLTHALVAGGPAINGGDKSLALFPGTQTALTEDARGFPFSRVVGAEADIGSFELQNITPTVAVPTTKNAIPEDDPTGITFAGVGQTFSIVDDVGVAPSYTITLASAKGSKITVVNTAGIFALTNNGTGTVSFQATTPAAANAALDGFKFVAAPNQYSFQPGIITITVNDGDTTALGGAKEVSTTGGVVITPAVDPPTVTSPNTATDKAVEVTFTRNPVDGNEVCFFKVTNVVGGTLSYVDPDSKTVAIAAGAVLPFTGSFFHLTPEAAAKLTFTPAAGFTGKASFDIQAAVGEYSSAPTTPPVFGGPIVTSTITVGTVATNTGPTISDIANPAAIIAGSKAGPFAFTIGDVETAADKLTVAVKSSDATLIPDAGLVLGGSGKDRTLTVSPAAGRSGTAVVTVTVTDAGGLTATDTFTVTVASRAVFSQIGVGAGSGSGAVRLLNADKTERYAVEPFPGFAGGVRTAAADFNADGVADLVVGTGPGRATRVLILDGVTKSEIHGFDPFEAAFVGGVYVATGDVNGDGTPDLVVTPDEGGGPRARVFNGKGFGQIADFFGINDALFRGGARPALGDVNGDGAADLIVAAGFGGGPRVAVFSGAKIAAEGALDKQTADRWETWKLIGDFLTFEPDLRNGSFVAVGDTTGDGKAELIAGGGPGGGPRVSVFAATDLLAGTRTRIADYFAGDVNNRGGIRVAVKDLDGDSKADVVTGAGTGGGSGVTAYAGATLTGGTPPTVFTLDAFPNFTGGVFVG